MRSWPLAQALCPSKHLLSTELKQDLAVAHVEDRGLASRRLSMKIYGSWWMCEE